jgi:nicotinamidase-related amidase
MLIKRINMAKQEISYSLIIIDMQNDFVMPGSPIRVAGAKATIPVIKKVLKAFRKNKLPVFHVVREYRSDGSDIEITRLDNFLERSKTVVPGTEGCKIVNELNPLPGEYRIIQNRFSAFMNTELDFMLRRLNITHLVICGTQYPSCIRTTVFDSVSYGYYTILVTDGTSAQTPEIAESNLRDIQDIGVECCPAAEFIKKLKST